MKQIKNKEIFILNIIFWSKIYVNLNITNNNLLIIFGQEFSNGLFVNSIDEKLKL